MPPVRTRTDTRGRKEYTWSFITPSRGRGRKRRREGERTGPHGDHTQHGVDQIPTPAGAIVNVASQSQPYGDELVGITTNQEFDPTDFTFTFNRSSPKKPCVIQWIVGAFSKQMNYGDISMTFAVNYIL
ncbi:uncharacterized protein LOC134245135 [Saccostrea cucullata]|uniref:uncharacterized protein LOC134245135 n=1 Tax=Saccostrea cuccullata TaxID=36930 RepID=UPI002ED535E1